MTFLEAVQNLKDGRCEGIRCASGGTLELSPGGRIVPTMLMENERGPAMSPDVYLGDWQLVTPKPVMETVEVKRWVVIDSTGNEGTYTQESIAREFGSNSIVLELSNSYQRPAPVKVKRHEEITLDNEAQWRSVHADSKIPKDASIGHFFFEWEDVPKRPSILQRILCTP